MSTTAVGDTLRDYVVDSLEADGHKVDREVRLDTKRVDILLTLDDDFVQRRVAVECKNLDRTITQGDVTTIYGDYLSLVERGDISEVWLVSRNDLSPEAKNWVDNRNNFYSFTVARFDEMQNGFRRYAREVARVFDENSLSDYYVQQRTTAGVGLADQIENWLDSAESRPLALLGGYGMGKTSFCRYLVAALAHRYLDDPQSRVPIYVRLSDLAKEQDLDGLIAKTLAGRYTVKNYHFEKFLELNRRGRFVLIFDGFDEMKHALSWSEFKYNFSQINRSIQGKAKVLVAGRPNAFLSDDEHSWALRGEELRGESRIQIPGSPQYLEHEIAQFDDGEAKTFLRKYLASGPQLNRNDNSAQVDTWIDARISEFESLRVRRELFRPVHLKIFSDIARDPNIELRNFAVYDLYEIATSRISNRDTEKPHRAPLDSAARQHAIEEVAWWVWERSAGRSLHFNPREVPASFVRAAFGGSADLTADEMYRELFSGAFVERKFGEQYYFAHRSFLEFFVAKRLSQSKQLGYGLHLISKNINPEVITFMKEGQLIDDFMRYVFDGMQEFSGELDLPLLSEFVSYTAAARGLKKEQHRSILIRRYLHLYMKPMESADIELLTENLLHDLSDSQPAEIQEGALFFAADFVRSTSEDISRPIAAMLISACAARINWRHRKAALDEEITMPQLSFSRNNIFEFSLLHSTRVRAELDSDGRPVVNFDAEIFYNDLYLTRRPRVIPTGREPATAGSPPLRFSPDVLGRTADQAIALEVLRRGVATRIVR